MKLRFFKQKQGDPPPLTARVSRVVRFEEVDCIGIVWHGRYPGFFEDARVAVGDKYGVGYKDFHRHNVLAPIKKMHVEYFLPLRFQEEFEIRSGMVWSEAARINHEFAIDNQDGHLVAAGYSVQMFVDKNGEYMLSPPEFYSSFLSRWKKGEL
ncbi:MAG: acyl-CoA thioesterase [Desulfonatronovibrionaceae bacterium]